jgi:hypothetical protein
MKTDTQPDAAKHGTSRAGVAGGDVSDVFCLQEIHHPSQVGSFGLSAVLDASKQLKTASLLRTSH